jgi:hypothetical protein
MEDFLVNAIASVVAATIYTLPLAVLGGLIFLGYVWPFLAARKSPPSDLSKIKLRMDSEAHRVIDIQRNGTDWSMDRRGVTAWRKYDVLTAYPDGTRVTRSIGVPCTLLSEASLVAYKDGVRAGIWTVPQLNPY